MFKPFIGTNPVKVRTIGYTYLGAEAEYTEERWDNYNVSVPSLVNPQELPSTLLATDCTKREAWDFFQGYTRRNPKAHVQIKHEQGQKDYADCDYDYEIVWSTHPEDIGSVQRERDHDEWLASQSPDSM